MPGGAIKILSAHSIKRAQEPTLHHTSLVCPPNLPTNQGSVPSKNPRSLCSRDLLEQSSAIMWTIPEHLFISGRLRLIHRSQQSTLDEHHGQRSFECLAHLRVRRSSRVFYQLIYPFRDSCGTALFSDGDYIIAVDILCTN